MSSLASVTRLRQRALLVVILAVAVSHDARAQRLVCATIRSGETAARVAQRITGDARNMGESWFQILDPATSGFVSKSSYDHILEGWRACIVNEPVAPAHPRVNVSASPVQRLRAAVGRTVRLVGGLDSNVVLPGLLVVLIAAASHGLIGYLRNRTTVVAAMQRFGDKFVQEFERPLIRPDLPDPPIQSRLRFTPHRGRFDVLLAPSAGRRYPNLADHKKNLEYDVIRVVQSLGDHAFVNGRPYTQGHWIVVPFQLTVGNTQAGVE